MCFVLHDQKKEEHKNESWVIPLNIPKILGVAFIFSITVLGHSLSFALVINEMVVQTIILPVAIVMYTLALEQNKQRDQLGSA